MPTLRDIVDEHVREGILYEKLDRNRVRCFACGHCCPIPDGQPGVCKVRYNRGGILHVPWGYVGGVQCDPIEKKPFFHAYAGALAYSFGMLGCDLHCGYCQNWVTSQALRDPSAVVPPLRITPEALVREALDYGAKVIVSTYNEPLITSEWAVAVFKEARAAGLLTAFVSNGNGTPRGALRPDRVGNGTSSNPTVDQWFDKSAFQLPALFTFGNSGRNILIGPGLAQSAFVDEDDRAAFVFGLFFITPASVPASISEFCLRPVPTRVAF
jgi:radical SAM family protein